MNKAELTTAVATKMEITKAEATRIIETVLGTIVEGAKADGECVVPGLGKLKIKETAERSGNSMGKEWTKPAGKKFTLAVSKEGKDSL
jgi:DNA-binding protein HU-beta